MKKIILLCLGLILIAGCNDKKVNEDTEQKVNPLVGKWVADGTQYQVIQKPSDANEDIGPYYLIINDDGTLELDMDGTVLTGTYEYQEDGNVFLNIEYLTPCKLEEDKLTCNSYASKFVRMEK